MAAGARWPSDRRLAGRLPQGGDAGGKRNRKLSRAGVKQNLYGLATPTGPQLSEARRLPASGPSAEAPARPDEAIVSAVGRPQGRRRLPRLFPAALGGVPRALQRRGLCFRGSALRLTRPFTSKTEGRRAGARALPARGPRSRGRRSLCARRVCAAGWDPAPHVRRDGDPAATAGENWRPEVPGGLRCHFLPQCRQRSPSFKRIGVDIHIDLFKKPVRGRAPWPNKE